MKVITIGRSHESNIVINDTKISRIHLQIVQDDNGNCSVVDLNSINGTFVNGQRIRGEVYLKTGDTVIIGDTLIPWQNYLNQSLEAMNINVIPKPVPKPKNKSKTMLWFILGGVLLLLLLLGGGVFWKINHDKKIAIEQRKKEIEEKEKKRIEDEANEAEKEAMKTEIKIEEQYRKEAEKKSEEDKKAKEEERKEKEKEKRAKEVAQAEAAEKERIAKENEKKKDKAEFDQLKIDVERLKARDANPAEKITEMKKIAEKYSADTYFQNAIKDLEK